MQVHLHTDHPLQDREGVSLHLEAVVGEALHRFRDQITRIEAHLGDRESHARISPGHVRLTLEARLAGLPPVAVTDTAATMHQAIGGAAGKLARAVDTALAKHAAHRRGHDKADPAIVAADSKIDSDE